MTGLTTLPAFADNRVTPGNFTGYGFDQCLTPSQRAMDVWLEHSPFFAVGIYISGDSRACRDQPHLTSSWVSTQLRKGWRLLPITLGPQAACNRRFPRYGSDRVIDDDPGTDELYRDARTQGAAEARKAVRAARALGIAARSTLWYDIEAFDSTQRRCRESTLAFLSAWTNRLHRLDYRSGVYSSAGSGILALEQARIADTPHTRLPDYLWLAQWDNIAGTSSSYLAEDGWNPHRRIKQYRGGHDETWGGITINIDRNFLDVGTGSVAPPESHCRGTRMDFPRYRAIRPGTQRPAMTVALKCRLTKRGYFEGRLSANYGRRIIRAAREWKRDHGFSAHNTWTRRNWTALLSQGRQPVLKIGSANTYVRRVQRALNATGSTRLEISGHYDGATVRAVRAWQRGIQLPVTGVISSRSWDQLQEGRFPARPKRSTARRTGQTGW
ncbi:MAG: glycoside hydrolase domain-containing protein [Nocardioides sp.]